MLLDGRKDPTNFYTLNITPHKADLEIWYVKNYSIWLYFKVIFVTAWVVVFPASKISEIAFSGIPQLPENLKT